MTAVQRKLDLKSEQGNRLVEVAMNNLEEFERVSHRGMVDQCVIEDQLFIVTSKVAPIKCRSAKHKPKDTYGDHAERRASARGNGGVVVVRRPSHDTSLTSGWHEVACGGMGMYS